jgi:CheY-like chemotaxis protein
MVYAPANIAIAFSVIALGMLAVAYVRWRTDRPRPRDICLLQDAAGMNARLDSGRTSQSRPLAPRRVLVVDDNVDVVETLVLLLRQMGHDAEFALNGQGAIDTARRFLPEFVFLDLALPGMDGYEIARRLRREPTLERVRIFALTCSGQQRERRLSLEAGCELHLVKPVDPAFLASLLGQGLFRTTA